MAHSAVFKSVEIPSGEWTHLAIVFDEQAQKFRCFVNGEKKRTISFADTCPTQCENGCKGIFSPAVGAHLLVKAKRKRIPDAQEAETK